MMSSLEEGKDVRLVGQKELPKKYKGVLLQNVSKGKRSEKFSFQNLVKHIGILGGATALGTAIDTITKPTTISKYPLTNNEVSGDYSISVGASNDDPLPDKKQFPIEYIIVGSVVFIGIIGVIIYSNKKKKLRMQQYS